MKIAVTSLIVALTVNTALPNEVAIQMRKRLMELDHERLDYRKPKQELPQEKEIERQAVIGWLYVNDGLWRLSEEILSQINALANSTINVDKLDVEIGKRRQALAIISDLMSQSDTALTEEELGQLRSLIAIGGREELMAWYETKRKNSSTPAPRNH